MSSPERINEVLREAEYKTSEIHVRAMLGANIPYMMLSKAVLLGSYLRLADLGAALLRTSLNNRFLSEEAARTFLSRDLVWSYTEDNERRATHVFVHEAIVI